MLSPNATLFVAAAAIGLSNPLPHTPPPADYFLGRHHAQAQLPHLLPTPCQWQRLLRDTWFRCLAGCQAEALVARGEPLAQLPLRRPAGQGGELLACQSFDCAVMRASEYLGRPQSASVGLGRPRMSPPAHPTRAAAIRCRSRRA